MSDLERHFFASDSRSLGPWPLAFLGLKGRGNADRDVKGPVQMATVQTTSPPPPSQSGMKVRFEDVVGKAPPLWWLNVL